MSIVIKTPHGELDFNQVKYMTLEGVEYAIMPIVRNVEATPAATNHFTNTEKTNNSLDVFFNTMPAKRGRKRTAHSNSIASKIRAWLDSKPVNGDTINVVSNRDYAIRVAAEIGGAKVKIRKIRKGLFNVTYDRPKMYARSAKKAY